MTETPNVTELPVAKTNPLKDKKFWTRVGVGAAAVAATGVIVALALKPGSVLLPTSEIVDVPVSS